MRVDCGEATPIASRRREAGARTRAPGSLVPPPSSLARPPRTPWWYVERAHLRRRLTEATESAPLTLVGAPAGTGKTMLATDWARRRAEDGGAVAWLTATERDDHPGVFWLHLQQALGTAHVIRPDVLAQPMFPDAADVDALTAQVLELDAPVVLVIDAAERLASSGVHERIERLVDTAGDRLRLVLVSRVDPPLPLHRYQVEERVAEIRADDLALGSSEVAEVLARHHLPTAEERGVEVRRRTEGWAAGVRLAALRLATDGPAATLDGFADAYLRAEVVAGLTPDEREVLTATCVVEELPPGLAPALTGRSTADELVRVLPAGNTFVRAVPGRPGVHRVHPLLRDVLRAGLDEARATDLHRLAGEWYDARGDLAPAVRHVAAAGEWAVAAARVVNGRGIAEVVVGTPTGTALAEDLAAIPDLGSPDVPVVRAAIALQSGDLDSARSALDRAGARGRDVRRGAAAALVRSAWYDAAGRPVETLEAAREARALLDRLAGTDPFTAAAAATAEGAAQLRVGDLEAACSALGEAVAGTRDADGPLRLRCLSELSLAEACSGRLTRALELAGAAEQVADTQSLAVLERPPAVDLARAWVALEQQDLEQARRSLGRLGRSRADRGDRTWRTIGHLLRARYRRDLGDLAGARRQLGRAAAEGEPATWLRVHLDAEVHDLGGPSGSSDGTSVRRVHHLLEQAELRCRHGELHQARQAVGRALQLGRTEQLRRPFVHAPPRVQHLLRSDARVQARAAWLQPGRPPATATERPGEELPAPVLDPLTGREHEVLRHLAAFLTTDEIAAEMFISVNTVRTHVRRVLEKLSVSRRHEAVRRGQELGLV